MLFIKDLFQHKIIQIGVKKAVKIIITKAKPSIPKMQLIFIVSNQKFSSINWKWLTLASKKKSIEQQTFKIIKDQKSPKFLIKIYLVLSIKHKKKQAIKGNNIIKNNISEFKIID